MPIGGRSALTPIGVPDGRAGRRTLKPGENGRKMQRFPLTARVYIWAVMLAGIPAVVCAGRFQAAQDASAPLWKTLPDGRVLLLLCLVSALASLCKVRLFSPPNDTNSQMSLGFVPTF